MPALVLDGVPAFPRSCLLLSAIVSFLFTFVGWLSRLAEVSFPLVSHFIPTRLPVFDGVPAFPRSYLPLSPLVCHSLRVPVLTGVSAFPKPRL